MKEYRVQQIEIYRQDIFIKADSASQAIKLVAEGEGNEGELHYGYTLEPDEWIVFEIK